MYKRLQYAKEILVQMMSVQSMPPALALNNEEAGEIAQEEPADAQNYGT